MTKFDESKFTGVVKTQYAPILGVAPEAIPPDLITLLMGFLSTLFTNCFKPSPSPSNTPDKIAAQIKGANSIQQAVIHRQMHRYYARQGQTRDVADKAFAALTSSLNVTPVADLAQAIEDASTDASAIPEVDIF